MLPSTLEKLTNKVVEAVKQHDMEGKRVVSKILKVRPKITQFNYNDGNIGHTKTIEFVETEEWHIVDQYQFLQKVVKEFDEYRESLNLCVSSFELDKHAADTKLTQYVQAIINKHFNLKEEFNVVDIVTSFIQDLNESPVIWDVKAAIVGLTLQEDFLLIGKFKLRRPVASDFETEERLDMLALGMPRNDFDSLAGMPTAFIEYQSRASTQSEIQEEFYRFVNVLRLYKLGSVNCLMLKPVPSTVIRQGGTIWPGQRSHATYKYRLGADDKEKLRGFIDKNEKRLKELYKDQDENKRSIDVSFQRYVHALSDNGPLESRITSAITCLESLLLKGHERAELSHRLSQRVAFLMNHFNFKPIKTYDTIHGAYDVRSTYIHGSELDPDRKNDINDLARLSLEYARICLCMLLQLSEVVTKESFIKKIDNAILDADALTKMKSLLAEKVEVFLTEAGT